MNAIMMANAPFYFRFSVPLVGILVSVVLSVLLCRRVDHLIIRVGEIDKASAPDCWSRRQMKHSSPDQIGRLIVADPRICHGEPNGIRK